MKSRHWAVQILTMSAMPISSDKKRENKGGQNSFTCNMKSFYVSLGAFWYRDVLSLVCCCRGWHSTPNVYMCSIAYYVFFIFSLLFEEKFPVSNLVDTFIVVVWIDVFVLCCFFVIYFQLLWCRFVAWNTHKNRTRDHMLNNTTNLVMY